MALLRSELAKLNGSLALLFALALPLLPAVLCVLALLTRQDPVSWQTMIDRFVFPLWVIFLLPMGVAALATLLAQIEYQPRAWDMVLCLPVPAWQVYLAKTVILAVAVIAMTMLTFGYTYGLGSIFGLLAGNFPTGAHGFGQFFGRAAAMLAASAWFCAIQLWLALRFGNFVIPLACGLGGTLVGLAVLITRTDQADWFPWVLPLRAAEPAAELAEPALAGLLGGVVILFAMTADLTRRPPR
jgi:lantibiotic transport system permease protein